MKIIGIIPARYASTRFPGKPLINISGKSMIRRVWDQASKSTLHQLYVATDNAKIYDHVKAFGGKALMTSPDHPNGTSRCQEALEMISASGMETNIHAVINIQGDEPFINPQQIDQVSLLFSDTAVEIATLARQITDENILLDHNVVKVVIEKKGRALYFSRQPIPFVRGIDPRDWVRSHTFYKHIGIYGYKTDVLQKIVGLPSGKLEIAEKLEQLRWMEYGFSIRIAETEHESIAIDTPEDLLKLTNSA
jgi:3-deoxy-manno-octulosonate cytidylyltransferase (CMP-KDO synthetase)